MLRRRMVQDVPKFPLTLHYLRVRILNVMYNTYIHFRVAVTYYWASDITMSLFAIDAIKKPK